MVLQAGAASVRNHVAKIRRKRITVFCPGRIHTRPEGRNHRPALGGANGARTIRSRVGHGFLAFDTESLDVSCQLGAVFQPKPGGNQSNVRWSSCSSFGESTASRIAQLTNGWVSRSAGRPAC
ncbi:hypothetical protein DPMN_107809 [Dreissena polymorpha]|uniref:Uncharacterized protein n=1 Tax=Dreissena polymorpha TaxID=45954 RepID=A0A9D4QKB1_DREPO|nr:hypothetical protein DPMN_107809 [Dreissena polymorpha]